MGKNTYIGVGNVARKVKNIYIGVDGKARKVKAGWIGVNGVAKQFYSAGGAVLTVGSDYVLEGYTFRCVEVGTGYAVLLQVDNIPIEQWNVDVYNKPWVGYVSTRFGNTSYYSGNVDGYDIHADMIYSPSGNYLFSNTLNDIYSKCSRAEKSGAPYGSGTYLVSKDKMSLDAYKAGFNKVLQDLHDKGYKYWTAWSGTGDGSYQAWCIDRSGNIYKCKQIQYSSDTSAMPIQPATFNLDTSKVTLSGNTLTIV